MSRIDLGNNITKPKTVPATAKGFIQKAESKKTGQICADLADLYEQLKRGELSRDEYKEAKDAKKLGCSFYTPHAHFNKGYKRGDGDPVDSGKAIVDLDGCEDFKQLYEKNLKGRERELGINMANISVSGTGGHLLFDIPEGLDRQHAQAWMANELGAESYDKGVHERERAVYIPCREYILYIDEELMFSDELHPAKLSEEDIKKWMAVDVTTKKEKAQKGGNALVSGPSRMVAPPTGTSPQCVAECQQADERTRLIAEGVMKEKGLQWSHFLNEGGRHTAVKIFLSGATQLLTKAEANGVLAELMPQHWQDDNIQELVTAFYKDYTNPNQRLLKYQEQLFTESQKLLDNNGLPAPVQNVTFTVNVSKLPIGLRESVKNRPANMHMPLIVGQMPALMALADGVSVRYCDGRIQQLGGMSIIIGEQASNKSAVEEAVELWLTEVRQEDDAVREREDKVREANRMRKANERAQQPPAGIIRVVPITISCSKLLKRLKLSQGHCLYSITTEAETLLKSNNSGAWAQKWDIYRNAFGRERWGTDFNSEQSESGDVKVAYNWTILGTPRTIRRMFSGRNESNAENGLSSRCMVSEMPDGLFARMTFFEEISETDRHRVDQAVKLLRSANGFYDTPKLRKAIYQWVEGKRIEASQKMDPIMDVYRRRAAVIGFRCGVVFMLLEGKESKACLDFALLMAEYTLHMQLKTFRPLLINCYKNTGDETGTSVNGNIFAQLPSPFSLQNLRKLKGKEFADGTLYSIISRWKADGWVEKSGKDSWTKLLKT